MEIWKKVNVNVEIKHNIEISNKGAVRKINDDGKEHYYKLGVNSRGYVNVPILTTENGRKNFTLHRLLMLTFVGGGEGLVINHIDGNRLNNSLENLEWVTRSQNCIHVKSIDGYKRAKDFNDEEILGIIEEYNKLTMNLNDLSAKYNVTRETMRTLINVKAKKLMSIEDYDIMRKIRQRNGENI